MRAVEKKHTGCYLPKLEIKDYSNMIDGKIFFDQPVKSNIRKFDNIRKISTGQGADYTTGCLLDYNYFKECVKVKAIDLSKQKDLNYDLKAIQQINFTGNLWQQATIFFIIEEAVLDFSQGTVKVLILYFPLIWKNNSI